MPNPALQVHNALDLVIPGYKGANGTDPFSNVPLTTDFLYNWLATRRAVRRDATAPEGITMNDLINAWRTLATPDQFLRGAIGATGSHLFLDGTRKVGVLSGANSAQQGTYRASVAVADVASMYGSGGVLTPNTSIARVRFPTAAGVGDSSIGVVGVFAVDPADTTAAFYVGTRAADASNDIRVSYLNAATPTLALHRNVATVLTAEIAAANLPVLPANQTAYVAIGLRISGTTGSIYHNGVKIGTVTLNAAGLALTGNGVVIGFTANSRFPRVLALDAFSLA